MIRRFFSTAANSIPKQTVQNILKPNIKTNFQKNQDWMMKEMRAIKPNPGYKKCDASELGAAMKDAHDKEIYSYYNR